MTLKGLINLSGGPARCASIWKISRQSVSAIFKRNSISRGLVEELRDNHIKQAQELEKILYGDTEIDFIITLRRSARRGGDDQ